jgi:hypothetical protein
VHSSWYPHTLRAICLHFICIRLLGVPCVYILNGIGIPGEPFVCIFMVSVYLGSYRDILHGIRMPGERSVSIFTWCLCGSGALVCILAWCPHTWGAICIHFRGIRIPGEPFLCISHGICMPGEPFVFNLNGVRIPGEPFLYILCGIRIPGVDHLPA